ncbi:MAG: hypothetical protein U0Q16_08430 [Bryobacteraceae bacterium]
MQTLSILVSRHSAFYSPLIATLAGPFLAREGLATRYGVLAPGATSREMLRMGKAHVIQSAVSSHFAPLEKGVTDLPVHFAQINCRDGFFLVRRSHEGEFEWRALEGRSLVADHAGQPLGMLRYALRYNGVDLSRIEWIDAGTPEEMEAAFRSGRGEFAHFQSPVAHRLEEDGVGRVVASVGAAMPEVAFSSLCALPEFLETDAADAFLRAYSAAREWVRSADPAEVARMEASYFPDSSIAALTTAVAAYQGLGCWNGGIEISRQHFEQAVEVFLASGAITRRPGFEQVVRG